MHYKKVSITMVTLGVLLLFTLGVWLASAQPVSAQCGSSASSCKNCHETQAQDPVNSDGTAWHSQHSFGDFCYLCHAGNNQATDKASAHTGMEAPLANIDASCKSCHPNDTAQKAQVYASTLGQQVGTGSGQSSAGNQPAGSASVAVPTQVETSASLTNAVDMSDPNLADYVQHYDETVLGKQPVNWGNVILIILIAFLALGGGGFVIINEKLVKVSIVDMKKTGKEYPADIVDMLPALVGMKSHTRKSLKRILDNPLKAEKVLGLIDEVVSDKKNEE